MGREVPEGESWQVESSCFQGGERYEPLLFNISFVVFDVYMDCLHMRTNNTFQKIRYTNFKMSA